MKKIIGLTVFIWIIVTSLFAGENNPNIVFIITDDLGWKDLGCYGSASNETPAIDKLAENGIRFTQAYAAAPVCSPTRASVLTGKYPARLNLTNYLGGYNTGNNSPILPANWKPNLDAGEITVAELLKKNGYNTGMVGKWHVGGQAPWNQGFDFTRLIAKNSLDYYNYSIKVDSNENEFFDDGDEYLTDKLTDYSVEFIRANQGKPFFLYLAYSAPHVFIVPRGDKLNKYFWKYQKQDEKFNPYYAAMVESIDDGVDRIVQTLKDLNLLENTLIVFTSDNGGLAIDELGPTPTSNAPLRKWKGHVYEGGIRVPAIVSWPEKIKKGVVSNQYFSSIDYLPTFSEITNSQNIPENLDGKSIWPVLTGENPDTFKERPVFWHYPHWSNQGSVPSGAVRAGDYKLIEFFETGKLELYNLENDISESVNLAEKMPEKAAEMHSLLVNWRKQVNANMPRANPDYQK